MNVLRNTLLVSMLAMGAVIGVSACTVSGGGTVGLDGGCIDDRDCDSGLACDPASGLCVDPGPPGTVVLGGACIDDSECDPGDYCSDSGDCVADTYSAGYGNPGDPCYYDGDCASDFCDIHTDTCN